MAVGDVWVLHGINTPSNFYSVVEDATPSPVADVITQFGAGYHQPLFTGLRGVLPEVAFSALEIGTAIAEFGLTGADLSGGNTDLYYRKVVDLGTREAAAGLVHLRLRMANAFGYITGISQAQGRESTVNIRIVPTYDGVNEPIVPAGSQALAGTPAAAEVYGLGPTTSINGTAVTGLQQSDLDIGADLMVLTDDGEIFPTFAAIRTVAPVLTLRGFDAGMWTDYGLTGTALTALAHYCRRKTVDGDNVADATATHCKMSTAQGLIVLDSSNGGGNSEAETSMRIHCRAADATSDAITLAGTTAIT